MGFEFNREPTVRENFMHSTPNMYGKASLAWFRFKPTIGSSRKVHLSHHRVSGINGCTPDEDIGRLHRPTRAQRRAQGTNTAINSTPVAR